MSQGKSIAEFGISDASIDKAKSLLVYMDKLAVTTRNAKMSYDRLNSSLDSLKLSKEMTDANSSMLDIIKNTGNLINSLKKVKDASLAGVLKSTAKKKKGGKGGGFSFLIDAAESLFASYTKGGSKKKGKGSGFSFLIDAAESLFVSYTKGGSKKKGKGSGIPFLIDAAESLFASYTKGGSKKKGKGGGLDSILGSAFDIFKSLSGSGGAKKGGGSVIDKGLKSFLPLLKKAGLKTALNPFKQVELIKMAAVGGWKVGSWINEKMESAQTANEGKMVTQSTLENKAYNRYEEKARQARMSGNKAAEYKAYAMQARLNKNEDKYQEYMAKSREAAKIQNQVVLNVKIDEKGRVTTETADMDTKSKITVDRGKV